MWTSILNSCHISTIKIIENSKLVFTGEGSFIHVHNFCNGQHLSTQQIFDTASIHGIKEINTRSYDDLQNHASLLMYGQKSLVLVTFIIDQNKWEFDTCEIICNDWIIDIVFDSHSKKCVIATAHNKLIYFNPLLSKFTQNIKHEINRIKTSSAIKDPSSITNDNIISPNENRVLKPSILDTQGNIDYESLSDQSFNVTKRNYLDIETDILSIISSTEHCLLYSGQIVFQNEYDDCVLLAGTIFSKVLIWGPNGDKNSVGEIIPFKVLCGHEGVLFSVNYDHLYKLIITTSDDRRVIVSEVKPFDGNDKLCRDFWKNCSIDRKLSMLGHSARVWKAKVHCNHIISVGEDSKICVWNLNGDLISQWVGHGGASIWSIELDPTSEKFITGGQDGGVKIWNLKPTSHNTPIKFISLPWLKDNISKMAQLIQTNQCSVSSLPTNNISINSICNQSTAESEENDKEDILFGQNSKQFAKKESVKGIKADFPRSIGIFKNNCFIVTNNGQLWCFNFLTNRWKMIFEDNMIKNYSLLVIHPKSKYIALATLRGDIIIMKQNISESFHIYKKNIGKGKIFSLNWFENEILVCQDEGIVSSYKITEAEEKINLELCRSHLLPSCRQRWVSAACEISGTDYLIIGGRCGSIYLFEKSSISPIDGLKKIHGSNGVTDIQYFNNSIITTGRDGQIRWIKISNNRLLVNRVTRVGNGTWLAGIRICLGQMYFLSFHGVHLEIWRLDDEQKVIQLECGGGHRSWDIQFIQEEGNTNKQKLKVVFLKDGEPFYYSVDFLEDRLFQLRPTFNSQETRCLKPMFSDVRNDLFLTGCEDTSIKLHHIQSFQTRTCLHTIRSHLSSIKCIFTINNNKNNCETWVASGGGRAQLKIWKLNISSQEQTKLLNCENTSISTSCVIENNKDIFEYDNDHIEPLIDLSEVSSYMLRASSKKSWKSQQVIFDPETRFMDGSGFWISDNLALISLASSDGFIRFLSFNKDENTITHLHEQEVGPCLLRIQFLCISSDVNLILVTSTSGKLYLFDIQILISHLKCETVTDDEKLKDLKCLCEVKVHQSGINSLEMGSFDKTTLPCTITIATGGDDNNLVITKLVVDQGDGEVSAFFNIICDVVGHASQIMGIKWLDDINLCSTSVDQRILFWKLVSDEKTHKLEYQDCLFTNVPDVQGLEVIKTTSKQRLIVYGVGVQVFEKQPNIV